MLMLLFLLVFNVNLAVAVAKQCSACRIPSARYVEIVCKHAQLDSFCSPSVDFLSACLDLRLVDLWHPATNSLIQRLDGCADIITMRQPLEVTWTSVLHPSYFDHI